MAFTDLMIDLETMGTRANAVVIAVGAVFFNPETGELGDTFDHAIDMADAFRYGRADGDTIKWWLQQSESARKTLIRGRHPAAKVWTEFGKFALRHGKNIKPWGNGASFDISMCDWQFGAVLGEKAPWQFWNVQDCRTIKRLADGIVQYNDKLEGTAHTALDDAIHQAKYVSAYFQGLRKNRHGPNSTVSSIKQDADDFDLELDLELDLDD